VVLADLMDDMIIDMIKFATKLDLDYSTCVLMWWWGTNVWWSLLTKPSFFFFKKNAGYIQELLNLSELVLFTAHHYQLHMHATMQNK
jgi:hypothetical protein